MMCFGMSTSRLSRMASLSSSPWYCSMSWRRMMRRTFSFTPSSAGSKSTKCRISTMPFVKTRMSLPSAWSMTSVTPQLSIYSARSRLKTSPGSAMSSPVTGSAMGAASWWPMSLPARPSFLLNL